MLLQTVLSATEGKLYFFLFTSFLFKNKQDKQARIYIYISIHTSIHKSLGY
jgi:hypothetical protein